MDTVSLLVYHHVRAIGPWVLLGALACLGLVLLGIVGLVAGVPGLQPAGEPLLAPFRWNLLPANVA
jgi:hypothetical protein